MWDLRLHNCDGENASSWAVVLIGGGWRGVLKEGHNPVGHASV